MKNTLYYYLIILFTIFLWATAFVGIRYTTGVFSGGALALLRYLVASFVMLIIYCFHPYKVKPNMLDLAVFLGVGTLGFTIYNVTLNHGERTVPAAIAGFIVGQMPVIITLIAVIFFKERVKKWGIIGFVISIIGLFLIVIAEKERGGFDSGIIYIFITALSGAFYSIMQKPLAKKFHPVEIVTYAMWGGTLILLIYIPNLMHEMAIASLSKILTVIYMGIFPGAIAYLLWSFAMAKLPAARVSSFLYLCPFVTLILGWLFLQEIPPLLALSGGIVAIIGAYIIARNSYKKATPIDS